MVVSMRSMRFGRLPGLLRFFLLVLSAASLSGCESSSAVQARPEWACEYKLERIGKAIAAYQAKEGFLPPGSVNHGGHRCSWRSLIAPYLSIDDTESFVYRQDEEWNSKHNRTLLGRLIPCRFTCPLESAYFDYPFVSYLMLVRDDRRGETGRLPDDAVLVVESVGCQIKYGEPRDILLRELLDDPSPFGVGKLNSLHPKVVKALRVDGKVIDIPKDIGKEDLRKLLLGSDAVHSGS
jgi:hypothetical protein